MGVKSTTSYYIMFLEAERYWHYKEYIYASQKSRICKDHIMLGMLDVNYNSNKKRNILLFVWVLDMKNGSNDGLCTIS